MDLFSFKYTVAHAITLFVEVKVDYEDVVFVIFIFLTVDASACDLEIFSLVWSLRLLKCA